MAGGPVFLRAGQSFYASPDCVDAVVAACTLPYGTSCLVAKSRCLGNDAVFIAEPRKQQIEDDVHSGVHFMTGADAEFLRWPASGLKVVILCCLIPIAGCSGSTEDQSLPQAGSIPEVSTEERTVTETSKPESEDSTEGTVGATADGSQESGTLKGVISFEGELPPPRTIQATKDPEVCMKGEGEVQDVHVKDGKLAGAVVELTVRGAGEDFEPSSGGLVIRQKNCRFTNPTIVAFDGAELTIYNDDPVQHNVNSGQWNQIQGPGPDPIRQKINFSGVPFVRVTCNIHNWMETWVYVAQSKFHAISGEDGAFRIDGIPPGKYRGTVIHPTLGRQRLSVTIEAGQELEESFVFTTP